MKGEKFRPTTNTQEATLLYKRFLHSLVSEINSSQSGPGQFTDISGLNISPTQRMIDIRESELNERIEIYKNKRIANQKEWYKVKSLINRKKEIKYFLLSIFSFFLFCIFVALD
ncbi:hypothetical protein, partial [Rothia sp. ND6WE1A]|uniref:hypothetical protein n=1 Tax=Rothia sp. ND6WE1A TaxID=1848190 RepID=UPI001E545BF9